MAWPALMLTAALVLAACGTDGGDGGTTTDEGGEGAAAPQDPAEFDLDELIEAAQAEGRVVSWNQSSRVVDACEAFEEEYGITCDGTKIDSPEQQERLIREVDAGNVQVDVLGYNDGAVLQKELIEQGYARNYVPPDMVDVIPEHYQEPLSYLLFVPIFNYNTEAYDSCPVDNVWQAVEPEWQNKFAMRDPAFSIFYLDMFSEIVENHADDLEAAYEEYYGEPLETEEENAGWEWIKRLAQVDPITSTSDGDIAEAIGAPGQSDPPIGLAGLATHRDIPAVHLGFCEGIEPFKGSLSTQYLTIAEGAPNPNAAELFVRFLLTEEGVAPWALRDIGAFSTNPEVPAHEDDYLGSLAAWEDVNVQPSDLDMLYERRPEVASFWQEHSH